MFHCHGASLILNNMSPCLGQDEVILNKLTDYDISHYHEKLI